MVYWLSCLKTLAVNWTRSPVVVGRMLAWLGLTLIISATCRKRPMSYAAEFDLGSVRIFVIARVVFVRTVVLTENLKYA